MRAPPSSYVDERLRVYDDDAHKGRRPRPITSRLREQLSRLSPRALLGVFGACILVGVMLLLSSSTPPGTPPATVSSSASSAESSHSISGQEEPTSVRSLSSTPSAQQQQQQPQPQPEQQQP